MKKYSIKEIDNYILVENENGSTLGYAKNSGVQIIEDDGFAFKDLNKNGILDPYEDWRLPIETRIADLVSKMSIEDISGLMMYSKHLAVTTNTDNPMAKMFSGTYDGKSLAESGKEIYELSDQQKEFIQDNNIRHLLLTLVDSGEIAAKWNNQVQELCESLGLGIPANTSSDPRHGAFADSEFNAGSGGDISHWPESVGLAATFDPKLVEEFGRVAAQEYRAMGITTALSPQVDLATDPRWMRFFGTFGEDTQLSVDMAQAYCNGFQSGSKEDWNETSVNAMVKHWPGGGTCEAGRDAHYGYGKFGVYPTNNFDEHLRPFLDGAFNLKGTKKASAVMPYYTISTDIDQKYHENVGNAYNKYIITDLLREKYQYDGVVCSDWNVTHDNYAIDSFMSGKCWGEEKTSIVDRHYKILMAGCDQFGGNFEIEPILKAYEKGVIEHGEDFMRKRFEQSATRLLRNIFQTKLFENPYCDPNYAKKVVGNPTFMQQGFEAQRKSIVCLKNKKNCLPMAKGKKVYIPKRRLGESVDWFGNVIPASEIFPMNKEILNQYYTLVENPKEADFALVLIKSPDSIGFKNGEYLPITLQYRPYTATQARATSIASDSQEAIVNRSYLGKTNTATNEADLDIVLETVKAMEEKPVIVSLQCANPCVVNEFESQIDGLVVDFGVSHQALLDILSGEYEPSGCLPFQMPKNMETVERQSEDRGHDMECHVDSEGHCYDFAYGLNYMGVIEDKRVKKYRK